MTLPPLGCPVSGKEGATPGLGGPSAVRSGVEACASLGPSFSVLKQEIWCTSQAVCRLHKCHVQLAVMLAPSSWCLSTYRKRRFHSENLNTQPLWKNHRSGHRVALVPTRPQRARAEMLTSYSFVTRGPSTPKSWASSFLIWPLRICTYLKSVLLKSHFRSKSKGGGEYLCPTQSQVLITVCPV